MERGGVCVCDGGSEGVTEGVLRIVVCVCMRVLGIPCLSITTVVIYFFVRVNPSRIHRGT